MAFSDNKQSSKSKGFGFLVMVALVVLGGVVYANSEYLPVKVRYKVTVNIDDHETLRSGYSVMEISVRKTLPPHLPQEHKAEIGFRGEAVSVDLPGGPLFALIGNTAKGQRFEVVAAKALYPAYVGGRSIFYRHLDPWKKIFVR